MLREALPLAFRAHRLSSRMWVFYFFAALLIWQGIASLLGGVRFLSFVRACMSEKPSRSYSPRATVIAPCRGLDQGFKENIEALFRQDYPAYEIIFVTGDATDPALAVIEEVRRERARDEAATSSDEVEAPNDGARAAKDETVIPARVVIAGPATESGQKVHNLLAALRVAGASSDVFVFVDSDARPEEDWLRSLVAPLADERVGATTGYRWFIPLRGGLASHLRAVWNASIASALGADGRKNFCWGGSTAIRRETFARLEMMSRWRGTLSDDFALMRALRKAGLPIRFVPNCLVASLEDCSLGQLLEFTTRQLKITRVYAPHFWKAVLAGSVLFTLGFFGGLVLTIARAARGLSVTLPLIMLMLIFLFGAGKSYLRLKAVALPLARHRGELRRGWPAHLLLWPLTVLVYLYNALAALFSRRIEWRGVTYELKSPSETVIISSVHVGEDSGPEGIQRAL